MDAAAWGLFAAVFLASIVEMVEALTIVMAMGMTRSWRSTLWGVAAALLALAGFTAVLGVAISTWLSESLLQLVIGTLLLIFGLQWLRKACLRASGFKALHDEEDEYAEQTRAARKAERTTYAGIDLFGFMVSFKGVFLEGVEVVFIVVTFGLSADALGMAVAGAIVAGLIVIALGVALRKPLSRIPENTLKYGVGIMLASFGTFWALEGVGWFREGEESLQWPGGRLALIALVGAWFVVTRLVIAGLTRARNAPISEAAA
jgi:uncharacterized membrane protein